MGVILFGLLAGAGLWIIGGILDHIEQERRKQELAENSRRLWAAHNAWLANLKREQDARARDDAK